MDSEELRYDVWIEDALRQVIERALNLANDQGLPGDHHFYITFKTGGAGVRVPPYLRADHPDEMTIVLQHQFEDLDVGSEGFSVSLRFKGIPELLIIPYAAITSFADPSVNFGLQLKTVPMDDDELAALDGAAGEDANDFIGDFISAEDNDDSTADDPPKSGEVIALDTFRNKRT